MTQFCNLSKGRGGLKNYNFTLMCNRIPNLSLNMKSQSILDQILQKQFDIDASITELNDQFDQMNFDHITTLNMAVGQVTDPVTHLIHMESERITELSEKNWKVN